MALNVCTAVIGSGCNTATATPSLAQWDVGQVLKIEGVDLPAAYQVEFSTEYTRNAIQKIGNADGVAVPNELLQRSAPITAYIVLHEGENDRETEYWITIHITPRTPPETITPDPEQMDVIDETIAALQDGVEAAQAAAESVQNMGVEAETLAAGSPASVEKTVDPETGEVTLSFGIPRGDQGNPGRPGTDGVTPDFQIGTVETLPPTSPATATITGTAEEPVLNLGIPQGQKGDPGGSGGTTDYRELENKPQINGHTLNGDQSASDLGLGTYSKPGTGIPKTDLASDVQQSLGKADSALQSAPVSSVAGKTGAVQLNAGDIEFDDSATYATGSVGAEVSAQKNAIDEKAPVIINTASGDIATFSDGADGMSIKHLVANIEAVQSGTGDPSPSNVRPITGWTGLTGARNGINQWDGQWEAGGINANGEDEVSSNHWRTNGYIPVVPGLTYYFASQIASGVSLRVRYYGVDKNYLGNTPSAYEGISVTIPNDCYFIRFSPRIADVPNHDVSVNYPATDHDYHSGVNNQTISVSWATEAGTVYGGTLDVVTGELTVDRNVVQIPTSYWNYNSNLALFWLRKNNNPVLANLAYPIVGGYDVICSAYKHFNGTQYANVADGEFSVGLANYSAQEPFIILKDTRFTTIEDFRTNSGIENVSFEIPLATPQTYQLDPVTVNTLLGNNTVYVDCGSVSVDYPADTGIVVADTKNAISQNAEAVTDTQSMIATVEATTTASKNYAVGDLLVYDGKLYEVTSAIATGATIIVGSNVAQTTVENQLASAGSGNAKWTLIVDDTTTEDKSQIDYDISSEQWHKVLGIMATPANGQTGQNINARAFSDVLPGGGGHVCLYATGQNRSQYITYATFVIDCSTGRHFADYTAAQYALSNGMNNRTIRPDMMGTDTANYYTKIRYIGDFPAGTTVQLYGIK